MAIAEITLWLDGKRDYKKGVSLLKTFCKNAFLVRVLESSETQFNRERLLKELVSLNSSVTEVPVAQLPAAKVIMTDDEFKRAPVLVQELKAKATELHKLSARLQSVCMTHLKEAMRLNAPIKNTDRIKYTEYVDKYLMDHGVATMVHELLDADDEKDALFYRIDYWKQHGKLPEEVAQSKIETNDKFFLRQALTNLRSQISKRKKKLLEKAGITNLNTPEEINACLESDDQYVKWLRERNMLERRIDELI